MQRTGKMGVADRQEVVRMLVVVRMAMMAVVVCMEIERWKGRSGRRSRHL